MILVSKFTYKGNLRIKLTFDFDQTTVNQIRLLDSAKYSNTHKCWHIDYSKKSYQRFIELGIPFVIHPPPDTTHPSNSEKNGIEAQRFDSVHAGDGKKTAADLIKGDEPTKVCWNNGQFHIKIPYREQDVSFIKSLAGAWWNKGQKVWIVRGTIENLQKLQRYFGCWPKDEFDQWFEKISSILDPYTVELFVSPEFARSIVVKIKGHGADFEFLKKVSGRHYDKALKRWILPNDQQIIDRVINHYSNRGARVLNRIPLRNNDYVKSTPSLKETQVRLLSKFKPEHRSFLKCYSDHLIRTRYSWRTMKSYLGSFYKFWAYFNFGDLESIHADQVNEYLAEISSARIAESTINGVISSIKFYYQQVVFIPDFKIERIERPRKGRNLPSILSVQEMDRLLRSTTNIKHTCLLFTLYSTGIRLNEVLSLRVQDIQWDRNQVFIQGGKGKKDRVVMLSHTLKSILILYVDHYQPIYWLFEGADKRYRYSSSSVQKVIKRAVKKAGIYKKVSTHSLRHAFATHLLDEGTDIRYIQELLGHKDIKTTTVYTHVTMRDMSKIQSPLDRLNMDNYFKKADK